MKEKLPRRVWSMEYIDAEGQTRRDSYFGDSEDAEELAEQAAKALIDAGLTQEVVMVEWCLDDGDDAGEVPDAGDGVRPCRRKRITADGQ